MALPQGGGRDRLSAASLSVSNAQPKKMKKKESKDKKEDFVGGTTRYASASESDGEAEPVEDEQITLRKLFSALAAFEPSLKTTAEGVVETKITLPDSLTSYRYDQF